MIWAVIGFGAESRITCNILYSNMLRTLHKTLQVPHRILNFLKCIVGCRSECAVFWYLISVINHIFSVLCGAGNHGISTGILLKLWGN